MPSHSPIYDALAGLFPSNAPRSLYIWDPPNTPLSTPQAAAAAIATYLVVIFGGRYFMKDRRALGESLKIPFLIHNLALTIGSGALLAVMLEEVLPILNRGGALYGICHPAAWTTRLETFYLINYYFKYWELLDTVFLVLKKKPLQFLHVYHHSATALLCYTQLTGKTSVSWVVIVLNLAVHVIMYFYYALSSLKIRVPWKQLVTVCQITQFVIDLCVVYFACAVHWSYSQNIKLPFFSKPTDCSGSEGAALAGCACLTSYLFLFLSFYARTYKKDGKAGVKKAAANGRPIAGNGRINSNGNGKSNGQASKQ
ncbi:GNS1/SUR4 membrane protein [Microstroma glucosiphilum]|uniref:Elongation of fatty acids protein n=1 Tax=Pseudomicrostroma glucosiphilum TaxID=1684307 RepID=A0A316U7J2_9BASI|nr:GNS1/SUR4 membrane protein [Pseudomicrostroma glucosiphilum]PWN20323.1 GNS1/SUR4 membrane protein [Pseudomicrostroma glucosiphilum]